MTRCHFPPDATAWDILQKDFLQSFDNYAAGASSRRARGTGNDKRSRGRVYRVVHPPHRPEILNDLANLRTFALGLPRRLAKKCVYLESPETFSRWAHAAQCQQKNDMKIRSIQGDDYADTVSTTERKSAQVVNRQQRNGAGNSPERQGEPGDYAPTRPWPDRLVAPDYDTLELEGIA